MRMTEFNTPPYTANMQDLLAPHPRSSTYADPRAFGYRPHKGVLHELIHHPPHYPHVQEKWLKGMDSQQLMFRSYKNAVFDPAFGCALDEHGNRIEDTFGMVRNMRQQPEEAQARIKAARQVHIPGNYALASYGWTRAYGHFLPETIVSAVALAPLVKEHGLKFISPMFSSRAGLLRQRPSWPEIVWRAYGFPPGHLSFMQKHQRKRVVRFENLIVSSTTAGENTYVPIPDTAKISRSLWTTFGLTPRRRKRLYLTRRGSREAVRRDVLGEAELVTKLRALEFEIVEPAGMSFAQQVALFSQAAVIFGVHGSAFANCMYAPEGCVVGEITPSRMAEFGGRWICNMTNILDQKYFYILAESQKPKGGEAVRADCDIIMPILQKAVAIAAKM